VKAVLRFHPRQDIIKSLELNVHLLHLCIHDADSLLMY